MELTLIQQSATKYEYTNESKQKVLGFRFKNFRVESVSLDETRLKKALEEYVRDNTRNTKEDKR